MKFTKFIGVPTLAVGLISSAASARAASFEVGFQATIASEGNALAKRENGSNAEGGPYYVSVHPDNPGYASFAANQPGGSDPAAAFQRPFTDPVRDWTWVGGGPNNVLTQDVRTDGNGLISYTTNSTTFDGFAQDQLTLWTTSDPGPDLLNPVTPRDVKGPGYRGGLVDITASIDVSALRSGTVYIFYGDFRGTPTLSAVMRDTDGVAPDLNITEAHLNGDEANRAEYYCAELEFETDGVYDEIEFVWNANGDGGTNGRFGGAVLTGVDAPPLPFEITTIDYDPGADTVALTWRSRNGASYIAKYSLTMAEGAWDSDMGDGLGPANDEIPDDGDLITVTFNLTDFGLEDFEDLFFRIEEE